MSDSSDHLGEKNWRVAAAQIGWIILIVATLYVSYFSHLGAIGFVGPDEPRYAWIARDMVETGDWVTPRLYGKPWFEKPVLYYWGAALSMKVFGANEVAARLPSAISALLATLALAWLTWRLYGVETARWLLLVLPTTVGMIGFSHAAATDMPFSGMLTIAMVCAAVVLGLTRDDKSPVIPQTPWLGLLLFVFFLGLAVLAKGPAAIILSGGAIFFWALFCKRWRDAFRLLHPFAIASFCLTALPWYILCAQRNPDFFRVFIIEHNFKRYLTPEFQHLQPFWYYAPVLLVAFLPWTAILLWTATAGSIQFWRKRKISADTLYFASWALFCVIFFSISKSKLPGYVLPSLPPLVALAARNLSLGLQHWSAAARWAGMSVAMLLMVSAGVFWYFVSIHPASSSLHLRQPPVLWVSLFALAGLFALILALWNRPQVTFVIEIVAMLCAITATQHFLIEPGNQGLSVRASVETAKNHWKNFDPGRTSSFRLSRGEQYGLNYYMRREVPVWLPEHRQPSWVFGTKNLTGDFWIEGMDCVGVKEVDSATQPVVCKDPGTN